MKELTMMLLYLSRFKEGRHPSDEQAFCAWKGYDFTTLNELDDEDYIWQGEHPSRRKSVYITEEGCKLAQTLLEKYDIADWEENNKEK